jgi:hypothetical protein
MISLRHPPNHALPFFCFSSGSTPTSNANDRYELAHSGSKSTVSDSPKSNSHDDSATGTPDPVHHHSSSNNSNNPSSGAHHHQHSSSKHSSGSGGGGGGNSHRGTPDHEHHSGGSPSMPTSSAPGFPPHFSSLASYYSQLNQAGHGGHANSLPPGLAHMAQYGQHPGVLSSGQNPYQMSHHQSPGSNPASGSASGDFRRALPVIF